jgi:hypothetical protein
MAAEEGTLLQGGKFSDELVEAFLKQIKSSVQIKSVSHQVAHSPPSSAKVKNEWKRNSSCMPAG